MHFFFFVRGGVLHLVDLITLFLLLHDLNIQERLALLNNTPETKPSSISWELKLMLCFLFGNNCAQSIFQYQNSKLCIYTIVASKPTPQKERGIVEVSLNLFSGLDRRKSFFLSWPYATSYIFLFLIPNLSCSCFPVQEISLNLLFSTIMIYAQCEARTLELLKKDMFYSLYIFTTCTFPLLFIFPPSIFLLAMMVLFAYC
jgi:hypothetical protein